MKFKVFMPAALIAALASTQVIAEDNAAPSREREPVTREQMIKRAAEHFDRLDRNGDGVVSAEELRKGRRPEGEKPMSGLFERIDQDGDGSISQTEFEDAVKDRMKRHKGKPGKDGFKGRYKPGDHDGADDGKMRKQDHQKRFDKYDDRGDGRRDDGVDKADD